MSTLRNPSTRAAPPAPNVVFEDGLGRRLQVRRPGSDETVELLCFHPTLTVSPAFEFAIRERVSRLEHLDEPAFPRLRGVGRRAGPDAPLWLVSDVVQGVRLSELLDGAERQWVACDLGTALGLTRQLIGAVAILHEHAPDVAHGAIGPERIVITPEGRLVLVEHALGAALEQLAYSRDRYWQACGILLPPGGRRRFTQRADVNQVGFVALSLLAGRRAQTNGPPPEPAELLASVSTIAARGRMQALPAAVVGWLGRALDVDGHDPFASSLEAWTELDAVIARSGLSIPTTAQMFLAEVGDAALEVRRRVEPGSSLIRAPQDRGVRLQPESIDSDVPITLHVLPPPSRRSWVVRTAVALLASLGTAVAVWQFAPWSSEGLGTLVLDTDPPGAGAVVDGVVRGVTPLELRLPPGTHHIELRGAEESRTMPVTIAAGVRLAQLVEWPKPPAQWGQIEVRTDPPGAQVTVDGVPVGPSPVRVDLAAGEHSIGLGDGGELLRQPVIIEPGRTTSLIVPRLARGAAAPAFGWLSVDAPVDVQVYERGQLLGTSQSARIMVPAGEHELEIVNDVLGYRRTRRVDVGPGRTARIDVEFPNGAVLLQATPGAEVWIDGTRVGETPVEALAVPLGPHEVLLRHPELGERRYAISVTAAGPVTLTADLTQR